MLSVCGCGLIEGSKNDRLLAFKQSSWKISQFLLYTDEGAQQVQQIPDKSGTFHLQNYFSNFLRLEVLEDDVETAEVSKTSLRFGVGDASSRK